MPFHPASIGSTVQTKLFIGGEFVDGLARGTIPVFNPYSGQVICEIAEARAEDVDRAVDAAKAAQFAWGRADAADRGNLLLKLAFGALLTQPFVHIAGSRYWTTAGPLWALMAVLAWQRWQAGRGGGVPETGGDAGAAVVPASVTRALYAVQVGLVALTGLIAAALVVLALVWLVR